MAGLGAGLGAVGGVAAMPSPPASSVVCLTSAGSFEAPAHADSGQSASGGEYLHAGEWQAFAASNGHMAAEHLATAIVERAAGDRDLTAEARRHFIQLVMLGGIGGLNPSEAADILQLSTDVAGDARLTSLTEKIREEQVTPPLASEIAPSRGTLPPSAPSPNVDLDLGKMLLS